MTSRQEQVLSILDRLTSNVGSEMSGAVAVSTDGIVLASRVAADINPDRIGAVAATMFGVTRRVGNELKIGAAEETILKSANGLFLVLPAGAQSVLAISLRQHANLGLIRLEARDAAQALSQVLS